MKKIALTLILTTVGVVLSAEEYTIQTISARNENSITPAFEKKIQKISLPSTKKKEGTCNIVTVGHYATAKEARHDLKKAKTVAGDAFVRPMQRVLPDACASATAKNGKENPKTDGNKTVAMSADANKSMGVSAKTETVQPILAAQETAKPTQNSAASVLQPSQNAAAVESSKEEKNTHAVFIYDRNLSHKSDIAEAIEYYKNSPYHSFKPVAVQLR